MTLRDSIFYGRNLAQRGITPMPNTNLMIPKNISGRMPNRYCRYF